jgi:hypothetical protein
MPLPGIYDRLVVLLQREDPFGVVHLRVQPREERLDPADGKRLAAPERVGLHVLTDPRPVGQDHQIVVALQRVHQLFQGAFRVAQERPQQPLLLGQEVAEQLLLHPRELLELLEHGVGGRGPKTFELLTKRGDGGVGRGAHEVRAVILQAHCGEQRGEVGPRKCPPRAGGPGRRRGVTPVVEQHPEAVHGLPQGARGKAHPGEVFCGEGDRDHRPRDLPVLALIVHFPLSRIAAGIAPPFAKTRMYSASPAVPVTVLSEKGEGDGRKRRTGTAEPR